MARALVLVIVVLARILAAAPSQTACDAACCERLAGLGRVWAAAHYFHPWLAWREVDWDAALVAAIPAVKAARDPDEYARAVQHMLDALDDPATRVIRRSPATVPPPAPLARLTDDRILIITLNPATYRDTGSPSVTLAPALAEWRKARGVVFDLRFQQQWQDRNPAIVGMLFQTAGVNQLLQFAPMRAPAQRSRMYSGLPPTAPGGSLFFHHAHYVRDGGVIQQRASARPKPVVFLVDESSLLPPIAPALQAAGRARIVAQGRASDAGLVERRRIELPAGVEVLLRTSELLYEDGTTGLAPDRSVPAEATEAALEAALDLARNPSALPPPVRMRLPLVTAPHAEKPYNDSDYPREELRLLGAFRLWAAVRYFFAYRDLIEEDWDAVLLRSLPQFLEARDALEYAQAIARMVACLGDTHAEVSSRALAAWFGSAAPPLRTRIIEGRPVVTQLLDEQAARGAGITRGDVVLEVDGEEAGRRIARLGSYLSASTPQSLNLLVMERWLNGPPGSKVRLKWRDATGRVRMGAITRRAWPGRIPWRSGPVWTMLAGGVGYVDLERLLPEKVETMFRELAHARAIIFDLRGYPRGTGWLIAPRLTARSNVVAARLRRPLVLYPEGRSGDVHSVAAWWDFDQYLPDPVAPTYPGKTVALIDERTLSQAEHAALFLRAANGTLLVGSPSAGANGDVTRFTLPGGVVVSFSGQQVLLPDGSRLQRVGLKPDVEVRPTIAGVRAGRDEVLEKALELLDAPAKAARGVAEAR
jgi:C-terminal processing protease CtpA/Prc